RRYPPIPGPCFDRLPTSTSGFPQGGVRCGFACGVAVVELVVGGVERVAIEHDHRDGLAGAVDLDDEQRVDLYGTEGIGGALPAPPDPHQPMAAGRDHVKDRCGGGHLEERSPRLEIALPIDLELHHRLAIVDPELWREEVGVALPVAGMPRVV